MTLPRAQSVDRVPIVYNDNEPTRVQTCDDDTQFLLGMGWGGMSYWVYVTLSCHNWENLTFATAVPILFTSFVYRTNVFWSLIHGIKRKPYLSVVWNWYHWVAIAILHQPRPTDSADINAWLQLSDTSSIPTMHGGFLLIRWHIKA